MSKTKYVLGERCKGIKYSQISHYKGAVIWWYTNRIRTHVSKGDEFHYQIIREREGKNVDCCSLWRGRATKWEKGIVTILMPSKSYACKKFSIPEKLVKSIKRTFTPKIILVDSKEGCLRILEKTRQKSENTDTISNHRGRI